MIPRHIVEKKAELINHGKINIPKGFVLPYYPSRSTAGPGAGRPGLVFGFNGTRVKLSIVRDGSASFSLTRKHGKGNGKIIEDHKQPQRACIEGAPYAILKDGDVYLEDVSLVPTLMHAPCQAFINITSKCVFDCAFCVTPDINNKQKEISIDRWSELILAHKNNPSLKAVSITSGVAKTPHKTVEDMVSIIEVVRKELPEIPIGVEPYLTAEEDIDLLYNAGATEIKLNLETPNRVIFEKLCLGLDYDGIRSALKYAVSVFGPNKVCSNLIVGVGETDAELQREIEELAKLGVVPTLRAVRVNALNEPKLKRALGYIPLPVAPKRLLRLAEIHKKILDRHELTTLAFETMCHRCRSCDIVPQQDI